MTLTEAPHRTTAPTHARVRVPVVRWIGRALAWVVIAASLAALAAAVLVPRLGAATPYTVLTGSMRATLPPGTLVVVRPVEADQILPGTVITYQLRSGQPTVVTHRVVQSRTSVDGLTEWQTKGDSNKVADERWVRLEQVRGSLWYAVPQLGRVNVLLDGPEHQLVTYAVAGLLAAYAGVMFAGALWGRRREGSS